MHDSHPANFTISSFLPHTQTHKMKFSLILLALTASTGSAATQADGTIVCTNSENFCCDLTAGSDAQKWQATTAQFTFAESVGCYTPPESILDETCLYTLPPTQSTNVEGETVTSPADSSGCYCSLLIDSGEFTSEPDVNGVTATSYDGHPDGGQWVYCCTEDICASSTVCPNHHSLAEVWCDFGAAVKGFLEALGMIVIVIVVGGCVCCCGIVYLLCGRKSNKTGAA